MKYSIVIPTYNRAKTLLLTLDSLVRQTSPASEYEIIVVDDGSTDNTREIVVAFQQKHPDRAIRYFWEENGGPAKARNFGIREARGDIIFFTDDDCIVPPNWMETLLDGYRRYPEAVGVGGWYEPANEHLAKKYFQLYLGHYMLYANPMMLYIEILTNSFGGNLAGNTANMSYKKWVLEEVGGFDENLTFPGAVDWELKKNVTNRGYHLLYIPYMVNHHKEYTLSAFFKKFFNLGKGYYYLTKKYPHSNWSRTYNINPTNYFINVYRYASLTRKFLWAHILAYSTMLLAKTYASHIKSFSEIIPQMPVPVAEIKILGRNIKNNKIFQTRFSRFRNGRGDKPYNTGKNRNQFHSVVIPTYNRPAGLRNTLGTVLNQTLGHDQYEIIVVDDGSVDITREVVLDFQKKHSDRIIRYFYQENSGPAKARNLGIRHSRGEYIFFTDDDVIVPPNWMESLLGGLRRYPEAVGVGGWTWHDQKITQRNIFAEYWQFRSFHKPSNLWSQWFECLSNDPIMTATTFAYNTANLCVKKRILEEIGGFRESFFLPAAEDTDLSFRILKLGHSLLYLPFHPIHRKDAGFLEFLKIHFNRGIGNYIFGELNKDDLRSFWKGPPAPRVDVAAVFEQKTPFIFKILTLLHLISWHLGILSIKHKLNLNIRKLQS